MEPRRFVRRLPRGGCVTVYMTDENGVVMP